MNEPKKRTVIWSAATLEGYAFLVKILSFSGGILLWASIGTRLKNEWIEESLANAYSLNGERLTRAALEARVNHLGNLVATCLFLYFMFLSFQVIVQRTDLESDKKYFSHLKRIVFIGMITLCIQVSLQRSLQWLAVFYACLVSLRIIAFIWEKYLWRKALKPLVKAKNFPELGVLEGGLTKQVFGQSIAAPYSSFFQRFLPEDGRVILEDVRYISEEHYRPQLFFNKWKLERETQQLHIDRIEVTCRLRHSRRRFQKEFLCEDVMVLTKEEKQTIKSCQNIQTKETK